MGLDIYAGTLTRYYCGDWKTVVQQAAEASGTPFVILRPGSEGGEDPRKQNDPEEVRAAIHHWRQALNSDLVEGAAEALEEPLDWDESENAPYFTDKPDWDGHLSCVAMAAYEETGRSPLPEKALKTLEGDPAYEQVANQEEDTWRYPHLYFPELWLPTDFDFIFRVNDIGGREITVGSSVSLVRNLHELNDRMLHGTDADLIAWRKQGFPSDRDFLQTAQFGLGVLIDLAAKAVVHRLPLKMDY